MTDYLFTILTAIASGLVGALLQMRIWDSMQNRLNAYIHERIVSEIEDFANNIDDNSELIGKITAPLLNSVMKQLGAPQGADGAPKDLKIGGFKIPAWAVQLGLQYFGKKAESTAAQSLLGNQ